MHKILGLYGTPIDSEHFRQYYIATHLPLAEKLPGLRSMDYSFEVDTLGDGASYFCIWAGVFDDAAAADAALQSPEGAELAADTENYATGGLTLLRYTSKEFKS
jgi:uncharacterized protein (TIGR02118 family)